MAAEKKTPTGGESVGAKNEQAKDAGMTTHEQNHAVRRPADTPSFDDAEGLIRAGLTLIPLHHWNAVDGKGRDRGKTPRDGAWTAREYDSREVLEQARRDGNNVGVRLPPSWMVLDVDPRNFPEDRDSLAELVADAGLDLSLCPHVVTGSGGHHYYFTKPADVQVLDSLEDYPGVEFKSQGRQVVAPGSIHPSGRRYEWDDLAPFPDEAPQVPESLLSLIRRSTRAHGEGAGLGELTPEMLAETLKQIEPEDFQDHDRWRDLMMACHHATAGEGRQEFIEWSTQDAKYQDDAWIIGRRWDSLHASPSGGRRGRPVTVKFLHKVVQEAGGEVARTAPEDDFDAWEDPAELGQGVDDEVLRSEPTDLPVVELAELRLTKTGKAENTFHNCLKLVRHINAQLGLKFNEFDRAAYLTADELPWSVDVGRRVNDDVLRLIRWYLIELSNVSWGKDDVLEGVLTVVRENHFHPVREYLGGLRWDGVSRLDGLFTRYAGAKDTPYVRAIGAKALIAAVRRVRHPGCKFDNVVVLESAEQGRGKSTFIKLLAPNEDWFAEPATLSNVESKDAPLALEGKWIIEMGEMSALSKSGVESMKAFVSCAVDRIRRPYGRLVEDLPRQCIFMGTTNRDDYLKDPTGNRRFWPVSVGLLDLDALATDRDQLWAEAAQREAEGESLFLPQELWAEAAAEQSDRVTEDPWADVLREFLDREEAWTGTEVEQVKPLDRVHASALLTDALGIRASDQTAALSQRLKLVMTRELGWVYRKNVRVGPEGRQGRGYRRPGVQQNEPEE